MSSADFRHIAFGGGPGNCERLFRAAVTAYCSLSRPTREEVVQLDDLALGLFDRVSTEARRFAAAALSECDPAPGGLVKRLCDEPVETAAPLLVRSTALTDVDLIALIARHGLAHARVIARRENLHPMVAALVRALLSRVEKASSGPESRSAATAVEEMREHLRGLMSEAAGTAATEAAEPALPDTQEAYEALREAALTVGPAKLPETLSRLLAISPAVAARLCDGVTYSALMPALRVLDLDEEKAFLVTAAVYPSQVAYPAGIRLFLERYRTLDAETAREKLDLWRKRSAEQTGPLAQYAAQGSTTAI